ncbi:MAG: S9 family peptidase [Ktedonobacteraceae bacterium]
MLKELQVTATAPWKRRYRLPMTYAVQIAASVPERALTVSNSSGVYQLSTWHVPSGELTQLTTRPEGVVWGSLSPDGRHVYYLEDHKGNECGHFVRVPYSGGSAEDITPDLPLYFAWECSFSRAGNRLSFTAVTDEGFDIYCVDVNADGYLSRPIKLRRCSGETYPPLLSYNGEIAVITTVGRINALNYHVVAIDATNGQNIAQLSDGEQSSLEAMMFSPLDGDMRVLATTNRSGYKRPLLWNPRTGERSDLLVDDLQGEVYPRDWSPDGSSILLCQFVEAVQHLYLYDLSRQALKPLQHPTGTFGSLSERMFFGPEGDIIAQWENATTPPQLIALDGETGRQKRVVVAGASEIPLGHPLRSVMFTSSDGQVIQGWLGLPDGEGPFPTILETHGGPTAVEIERFAPGCQAWLDHGFAYLTINYRGSTSFGRDFEEKIHGDLGHWEVEDMVAGRSWLVEQGIAKPDQVVVTGWSYGGYLTLLALGKRPELWAGGMAGVAIGDFAIIYEDEAEMLRAYLRGLMGATPQEEPEAYAASSPITYTAQVKAPVLLIQGRNDTRCPPRSIEMYESKMQELGKPIEVYWFDAGHLTLQVEQEIDHQERMMRFAYHVLDTYV